MTFQAYIDNIEAKTGTSADEFLRLTREKGFMKPGVKATPIVKLIRDTQVNQE